jgi:hypothetical protein
LEDYEVVLVNDGAIDGATDGSPQVCNEYAAWYSQSQIIYDDKIIAMALMLFAIGKNPFSFVRAFGKDWRMLCLIML